MKGNKEFKLKPLGIDNIDTSDLQEHPIYMEALALALFRIQCEIYVTNGKCLKSNSLSIYLDTLRQKNIEDALDMYTGNLKILTNFDSRFDNLETREDIFKEVIKKPYVTIALNEEEIEIENVEDKLKEGVNDWLRSSPYYENLCSIVTKSPDKLKDKRYKLLCRI